MKNKKKSIGNVGDIIIVGKIKLDNNIDPNDGNLPDETKIMLKIDNNFFEHRPAKITDKLYRELSDGRSVYIANCTMTFRLVLFDGEFKVLGDVS